MQLVKSSIDVIENIMQEEEKEISIFTQTNIKRAPNPLCKQGKELAICGHVILSYQKVKDLSNQKWRYMQELKSDFMYDDMNT